jgi:predicted nuclease of restriction endonuclease-like (RecB) superfamily
MNEADPLNPQIDTTLQRSEQTLLSEIRQLIDAARQRAVVAINAEITLLYWQVGKRIQTEILQGQRAEYGKQVIIALSQKLTQAYGRGWSERQLNYCILIAEVFPNREILHTLCAELSWSHLKLIIGIENPLKRDFYIEIAKLERWSVRQLQERINSMLFERTALSRKPEDTIRHDLEQLRQTQQVSPNLLLKDPYILDFLDLNDRYLEKDLEDAILRDIEQFLLELGAGEVYPGDSPRYLVEFADLQGREYAMTVLQPDEILALHYELSLTN